MTASWTRRKAALTFALLSMQQGSARAQTDDRSYFKGRTITIITGTGAGGGYDLMARVISRYMPKYLPGGPSIIVQNMPGAANTRAAAYVYEVAPKDGTVIGVVENATPLTQVLEPRGVHFDPARFNWIGATGGRNYVVIVMRAAGVLSIDDARNKETPFGVTGPGGSFAMYSAAMNNVLGTKFKIVSGYPSSTELFLAMDRGEVAGRVATIASIYNTYPQWISENKLAFIAQIGLTRDPELPSVPLLTDLATTDEARQLLSLISSPPALGQPYFAPPGLATSRLQLLRSAFASTLKDPEFIADAAKIQVELAPISGEDVARIVTSIVGAPPPVLARARAALGIASAGTQ